MHKILEIGGTETRVSQDVAKPLRLKDKTIRGHKLKYKAFVNMIGDKTTANEVQVERHSLNIKNRIDNFRVIIHQNKQTYNKLTNVRSTYDPLDMIKKTKKKEKFAKMVS